MKLCQFSIALGICTQATTSLRHFFAVITMLLPKSKNLVRCYCCLAYTSFPGKEGV